jgi:hypothetical protein
MLDASQSDDVVGVSAEHPRLALEHLDLETEPLVEVEVKGRQHPGVMGMAGLDESFGQLALLVVVKQGQARDGFAVITLDLVLHQTTADEIANGLRSVAELAPFEELFEPRQKVAVEGDTDAFEGHGASNPV